MKALAVARPRLMRQPTASNACTLGLDSELAALLEIEVVRSRGHAQDIGQNLQAKALRQASWRSAS